MYELLPFWYAFFTKLGFSVVTSGPSSRELYLEARVPFLPTLYATGKAAARPYPPAQPDGCERRFLPLPDV
ncbi:MAG: acyl-CoA dehydratase activase-related protein [Ruthenibacterium lactatiformans]